MDPMEEVRRLGAELSNWGRWGPDDEKGAFNLITPEAIVAATRTVRRGAVFSLALPLDDDGPANPEVTGRFNPIHRMTRYRGDNAFGGFYGPHRSCDDMAILGLQSSTQWDALAHVWYDDRLYNGFASDSITAHGASRCAISNWAAGVVARGVLLDVPRAKGLDVLPPDYPITPDDLDAAVAAQAVEIEAGDVILLRTGALGDWLRSRSGPFGSNPGLSLDCARWLKARDVAGVCADNTAVEVSKPEPGRPRMGLHMVGLRDMGLMFGELYVLDALAADCAADGVYAMLFCAPPLNFPRAVGTPVNPLAIK